MNVIKNTKVILMDQDREVIVQLIISKITTANPISDKLSLERNTFIYH